MRQVNLEGDKLTQTETSYPWKDKLFEKETSWLRMGRVKSEGRKLTQTKRCWLRMRQVTSESDKFPQIETS